MYVILIVFHAHTFVMVYHTLLCSDSNEKLPDKNNVRNSYEDL